MLRGPVEGSYLAMSDNGFGAKANSPDALLRVYAVRPDFEAGVAVPVNRVTGEELSAFTADSYNRLLVINDNNYPGSAGRELGVPDNNEFIVIHVAPLLKKKNCRNDDRKHHVQGHRDHDQQGHEHSCRLARE